MCSSELLIGTRVTDIRGNSSRYLLLAPTVPYFGSKHLPFAILAIVVLSTFIALPPLLLIAYLSRFRDSVLGHQRATKGGYIDNNKRPFSWEAKQICNVPNIIGLNTKLD